MFSQQNYQERDYITSYAMITLRCRLFSLTLIFFLNPTCKGTEGLAWKSDAGDICQNELPLRYDSYPEAFHPDHGSEYRSLVDFSSSGSFNSCVRPTANTMQRTFSISTVVCKRKCSGKSKCYAAEASPVFFTAHQRSISSDRTKRILRIRGETTWNIPRKCGLQKPSKWSLHATVIYEKTQDVEGENKAETVSIEMEVNPRERDFFSRRPRKINMKLTENKESLPLWSYNSNTRPQMIPVVDRNVYGGSPGSGWPTVNFYLVDVLVLKCDEDMSSADLSPLHEMNLLPKDVDTTDPVTADDKIDDKWAAFVNMLDCKKADKPDKSDEQSSIFAKNPKFNVDLIRKMTQDEKTPRFIFEPNNLQDLLKDYPSKIANIYPVVYQIEESGNYLRLTRLQELFILENEKGKLEQKMSALSKFNQIRSSICYVEQNRDKIDFEVVVYVDRNRILDKARNTWPYIQVIPTKFAAALKELMSMEFREIRFEVNPSDVRYGYSIIDNPFTNVERCMVRWSFDMNLESHPELEQGSVYVSCDNVGDTGGIDVIYKQCIGIQDDWKESFAKEQREKFNEFFHQADLFQAVVDHGWIRSRGIEHALVMCEDTTKIRPMTEVPKFLLTKVPWSFSRRHVNLFPGPPHKFDFCSPQCTLLAMYFYFTLTVGILNGEDIIHNMPCIVHNIRDIFNVHEISRPREGTVHGSEIRDIVRTFHETGKCGVCDVKAPQGSCDVDDVVASSCHALGTQRRPIPKELVENISTSRDRPAYYMQSLLFGVESLDRILPMHSESPPFRSKFVLCVKIPLVEKIRRNEKISMSVFDFDRGIYNNINQFLSDTIRTGTRLLLNMEDSQMAIPAEVSLYFKTGGHALSLAIVLLKTGNEVSRYVCIFDSEYVQFACDYVKDTVFNCDSLNEKIKESIPRYRGIHTVTIHYPKFAHVSQDDSRRMEDYKLMKDHLRNIAKYSHDSAPNRSCQCGSSSKCLRQILDKYSDSILSSLQETVNRSKFLTDVNIRIIEIMLTIFSPIGKATDDKESWQLLASLLFLSGKLNALPDSGMSSSVLTLCGKTLKRWYKMYPGESGATARAENIKVNIDQTVDRAQKLLDGISRISPPYRSLFAREFAQRIPLYRENVYSSINNFENYAKTRFGLSTVLGRHLQRHKEPFFGYFRHFIEKAHQLVFQPGQVKAGCIGDHPWQKNALHLELLTYLITESVLEEIYSWVHH